MNIDKENLENTLPFDQYSRQYIVSSLIDKALRPLSDKKKFNIIDLGGHKGKTVDFQPNDKVTILDVFDENYENYVKGDATKTSFSNGFFDVACSFDVFEHIPRKKRQSFLNEALRISKYGVFLTIPIDVDGKVSSAEVNLNNFNKILFSTDHKWLKEHIDYKIPDELEIKQLIDKCGADYVSISSNQIGDWQLLQMLVFAASNNPYITEDVNKINAWYNTNIDSLDSGIDIGYRKIFFISKHKDNIKSVRYIVDSIEKKEINNYITINKSTFNKFTDTLSQINKKYIDLFRIYQKVNDIENKLSDEVKLLKENLKNSQDYNIKLIADLSDVYSSSSWKLTKPLRLFRRLIKNDYSVNLKQYVIEYKRLFRLAQSVKNVFNNDYNKWIKEVEPGVWVSLRANDIKPLISVIVPAYNTPDKYLYHLVQSLKNQTYENWQLCISDASTDNLRKLAIEKIAKSDKRISYVFEEGLHISDNTNNGLKIVKGDFVGLLDHDDILSPHALEEVAYAINQNKNVDIIYSDEDKLSDDGKERLLPFFKPDWSPDLLLGVNYITHFTVVRKSFLESVGLLRSKCDGAQDYDLLLRLTEKTKNIVHIPKILYHWRLADGSTAKSVGEKNYADNAGQLALRDAVKRRNIDAEVIEIPERPTNYRLKYNIPSEQPKVSIIIPFKDKADLLKQCVDSILDNTSYKNYELILVSNNSVEPDTEILLKNLKKNKNCKVFYWDEPFNYSKINNFGVNKSTGDYIVLLNNDTQVITKDWLEEMIGVASQPGVGAVGPMLLYPNKKDGIQHAGIILGMGTMAGHVFRHHQPMDWTEFGMPVWPRNYLAVTGACLVVSKEKYNEVGGLDEVFTVAGSDVAFCLRLYENGYRNIYWPAAQLYHHESVSVGTYDNGIQLDYDHSLKYYEKYHRSGDLYFNKNLDLMNERIGIRGRI